jgi:hypothetical protein
VPCVDARTIQFGFPEKTIQLQSPLTITGTAVIAGVPSIDRRNSDLNGFRATISGSGHESPVRLGGRRNQGAPRAKRGRRGVIA